MGFIAIVTAPCNCLNLKKETKEKQNKSHYLNVFSVIFFS